MLKLASGPRCSQQPLPEGGARMKIKMCDSLDISVLKESRYNT